MADICNKRVEFEPEIGETKNGRLFPQHPLFWAMLGTLRVLVREDGFDIRTARWYVSGFKWGWLEGKLNIKVY